MEFDGRPSESIKDGAHIAPNLQFLRMTFATLVGCGAILHYPYPWIGVGPSCLAGLHSQLRGACRDVLLMFDLAIFFVLFVSGGRYSSGSDTRSVFTRHGRE